MLMSDMQSKDIINTKTGARLGRIVDINVNSDGIINYLVVSCTKMMRKTGDYKITSNHCIYCICWISKVFPKTT